MTAIDASQTAIKVACDTSPANVEFNVGILPRDFPSGIYDLIILSEVLYYFDEKDLRALANNCCEALASNGEMITCHWLGETDYPLSGQDASGVFAEEALRRTLKHRTLRNEIYRLESYSS